MAKFEKKQNPRDAEGFMKCYTCGGKVKYNSQFYALIKQHFGIRWEDLSDPEKIELGGELRLKGIYPTLNPDMTNHICSENLDKSVVMQSIESRLDNLEDKFSTVIANIEKLTIIMSNVKADIQKSDIISEIRVNFNKMIEKIESLDDQLVSKLDYYYRTRKKT